MPVMKLVATLSHLFPTLRSSPASSLGARTPVFPGPPRGGVFLLSYHVPSVSPPKGCVFRKGPGEGDCDAFNSARCSSGVVLGTGWAGWRRWALFWTRANPLIPLPHTGGDCGTSLVRAPEMASTVGQEDRHSMPLPRKAPFGVISFLITSN